MIVLIVRTKAHIFISNRTSLLQGATTYSTFVQKPESNMFIFDGLLKTQPSQYHPVGPFYHYQLLKDQINQSCHDNTG